MKPRGPLMIEHRLIEKMIDVINTHISFIEEKHKVDPLLIDTTIDFIKTYADRTHHGKEEDILFKKLERKKLSKSDKKNMADLVEDHKFGRELVREIVSGKERYLDGDQNSIMILLDKLKSLVKFYPEHIKKEDDIFFPDTEKYFTEEEQNDMLTQFWEFDRKMIHEKYDKVVEQTKKRI